MLVLSRLHLSLFVVSFYSSMNPASLFLCGRAAARWYGLLLNLPDMRAQVDIFSAMFFAGPCIAFSDSLQNCEPYGADRRELVMAILR